MSSYANNYLDLLKIASQEFNDTIENGNATNFFEKLSAKNYYNYLGRYYYNKSLSNEYENKIIVVPKNGYITQRLVYLNSNLSGGTQVGTQAINITEQNGNIQLRNSGAVTFCSLERFFNSLCYAFGIEVDKTKINIYSLCDSVLQDFEFVYNRETGLHITINGANFNNVYVLYIVEDEKTYFDEDLVQAFANKMYEAGWFTVNYEILNEGFIPINESATLNPVPFSRELFYETAFKLGVPSVNVPIATSCVDLAINALVNYYEASYGNSYANTPSNRLLTDFECCGISVSYTTSRTTNIQIRLFSLNPMQATGLTEPVDNVSQGSYQTVKVSPEFSNAMNDRSSRGKAPSLWFSIDYRLSGDNIVEYQHSLQVPESARSSLLMGTQYTYNSGGSINCVNCYPLNAIFIKEILEGISIIDGAKLPTGLDSLSTDYSTWFSNIKSIVGTAVSDIGDALRNVFNIIEFVPLTLIGGIPSAEVTQDTTHTGIVLSPDYIGTLPEYTVKYLTPLPKTDTPISPTSPYYPNNPDYPSDTPIGNPIVDPINPPAIGGVTPPIPDNPIINSSNGLFTVYNPTQEQLNQFGGYLWGEDIVGILQSIFQNPMQAIISLHVLYATPATGDERPIRLGYMTSNVNAKEVTEQYINIDCGTVNVPEYYGNVLDYSPYTKAHIYLPFIGIREINVNEIMGSQVNVNYKVDVLTGSVYASISVFHNAISQVLYTFEGNCAVQLPMTGGDVTRLLSGMITGMAVGAKGGLTGAVIGTATGAFASGGLSVSKTNSIGANAGAMGIKKPYIIITHSQAYMANNYNAQYGYPSNLTTQLSACKGYTRVKEVHVENILVATQEEKDMIQTLLRQGVIIE